MPKFQIRQRLIPYRILAYLLYAPENAVEWLSEAGESKVRVSTGDAARAFKLRNKAFWDALYWLEDNKLLAKVAKERKRGSVIITLVPPTNLNQEEKQDG